MNQHIKKVCDIVGNQAEVARQMQVTRSRVNQWVQGVCRVPAGHVITLEKLSGGEVTRHQLRPDIYPEEL